MVANPEKNPEQIVKDTPDFQPLHDVTEIEGLISQVLAENSSSVADFKAGRDKAFAYLVGQVMKLSRGKAAPQVVNEILKRKINNQN
jgi:aspartyl-tRNA(Asn)/glutamyl-tRNA(Gln) amidotransferase subunit B